MQRRKLKHGYRWWFDKMVNRQRLHSRTVYMTRAEAERAEADAVTEYLRTGRLPSQPGGNTSDKPETVAQLFHRWVAWLNSHRSLRHARDMESLLARACAQAPALAGLPAAALTAQQVEHWAELWRADLLARGKGAGEVNKFLRYGQTAFNMRGGSWGRRRGSPDLLTNPFEPVDRFSVEKSAKYVPTTAEVGAVRLAAHGEFRLYLEVLIQTGARPSEGLALAWEDVGTDWVILYTRKTGTGDRLPRRVPMGDDLAVRFKAWRRAQPDGMLYVFQQEDQAAPHHYVWPRKQHQAACGRAGVRVFPVGCYRHYHAVSYYKDCKDLLAVQLRLGHRDAKTTQHYLQKLLGA